MAELAPGFMCGAIVRRHGSGPNMLVLRAMGEMTVVAVCALGQVRLRVRLTHELVQVLDHG